MFPKIVKPPKPNILGKTPPPDRNAFIANVRNAGHDALRGFRTAIGLPSAADLLYGTPELNRYTPEALSRIRQIPVIAVPRILGGIIKPGAAAATWPGINAVFVNSNYMQPNQNRTRIINHEVAHVFDLGRNEPFKNRGAYLENSNFSGSRRFADVLASYPGGSPFPGYAPGSPIEQYAQFTEQPAYAGNRDLSEFFPYYNKNVMRPPQEMVQPFAHGLPIPPAITFGERPNANFASGRPGLVRKQTYQPPPRNILQENKTSIQPQWPEANIPLRRKAGFNIR